MSDFSHDGFFLHPELRDKRKPVSMEWLKGARITAENLKKGTDPIELLARPDWVKAPASQPAQRSMRNTGKSPSVAPPDKSMQNAAIMPFGKYKGQLLVDILEENPGYLRWCVAEIDGFEAKLRKAGINPDEIE